MGEGPSFQHCTTEDVPMLTTQALLEIHKALLPQAVSLASDIVSGRSNAEVATKSLGMVLVRVAALETRNGMKKITNPFSSVESKRVRQSLASNLGMCRRAVKYALAEKDSELITDWSLGTSEVSPSKYVRDYEKAHDDGSKALRKLVKELAGLSQDHFSYVMEKVAEIRDTRQSETDEVFEQVLAELGISE